MKYGFSLIMRGAEATRNGFEKMSLKAEELGLDSLWASDHIVIPELKTSKYPGRASGQFPDNWLEGYWEPFTVLSYVAAITKKITLGTSVLIMPMRNPIEVAHQVADVDQLTDGRFVFGVGVGWFKEEFDVLDWPFNKRGARTNEGLDICKALWTQERPSFAGKYYSFDKVYFGPKPAAKPHPPIWVGGKSEAAYKRVARFADAWHPNRPTFESLEQELNILRGHMEAAGRKLEDLDIGVKTMLTFQDGPPAEGQMPTEGTPEMIVSAIKRYEELGATHFTFDVTPESLKQALYTMERFVNEVRPKL
jgi:probable F420-dependent oxidoreductase